MKMLCDKLFLMTHHGLVSLLSILLLSTSVFGQNDEGYTTEKTKEGTVKYKKKTVYEFTGSELEGKLKSPSGAVISPRKKVKVNRLIRLRTNFDEEVQNSTSGTR